MLMRQQYRSHALQLHVLCDTLRIARGAIGFFYGEYVCLPITDAELLHGTHGVVLASFVAPRMSCLFAGLCSGVGCGFSPGSAAFLLPLAHHLPPWVCRLSSPLLTR